MKIKRTITEAKQIAIKMYKVIRKRITDEQWQTYLEEIKKRQVELDGKVLEGAELEEVAKANLMARLITHAQNKDKQ